MFHFEALDTEAHFSDNTLYYLKVKGLGIAQKRLTENVEKKTNGK